MKRNRRGVTLVEMLIVVALVGLLVGITFPSVTAGIETLRLNQACNSVAAFINDGLNRAERRQQVVEIAISKAAGTLTATAPDSGYEKKLELPQGITLVQVLPELPQQEDGPRRFLLYPGGAVPRFGVALASARGLRRIVRVDPITGVPRIEVLEKAR